MIYFCQKIFTMKKIIAIAVVFLGAVLSGNAQHTQTSSTAAVSGSNHAMPQDNEVYKITDLDKAPVFKDGQVGLEKYLKTHLEVPEKYRNFNGTVFVSFIISNTGMVKNAKVLRSCGNEEIDKIALDVFKNMPPWLPGQKDGKKVSCQMQVPVVFGDVKKKTDKKGIGKHNLKKQ